MPTPPCYGRALLFCAGMHRQLWITGVATYYNAAGGVVLF